MPLFLNPLRKFTFLPQKNLLPLDYLSSFPGIILGLLEGTLLWLDMMLLIQESQVETK